MMNPIPVFCTLYPLICTHTCCFRVPTPCFVLSKQLILHTPFISPSFITAQTAFHHCTFSFITAHFVHHCTLKQALFSSFNHHQTKNHHKQTCNRARPTLRSFSVKK